MDGKSQAFCALHDRKSAESFARSIALRSIRRFAPHSSLKLGAALQAFFDAARRSPCSAQALGDHPWSPVERMRSTHGWIHGDPKSTWGSGSSDSRVVRSKRGPCKVDRAVHSNSLPLDLFNIANVMGGTKPDLTTGLKLLRVESAIRCRIEPVRIDIAGTHNYPSIFNRRSVAPSDRL
jgi:hypothetical protein